MRNSNLNLVTEALLVGSGSAGEYLDFNFLDGSIYYFGKYLKQAFRYVMIDNIGEGLIRVAPNYPDAILTESIQGAKTLKASDALYLEEEITSLRIYFIEDSSVELICKSDMSED